MIETGTAPGALRIVVIGAGAVGSFLGGTLARAGHEVTFLLRRAPDEADDGGPLLLLGPGDARAEVAVRRTADATDADTPDLVIVAVKAFDLAGALDAAAAWPDVPLMTVQNGVGAEDAASMARPSPILAGSLTTAVEPAHGGVRRLRRGGMGVAVVRGGEPAHDLARRLAAAWTDADLPSRVYPDAAAMKWSKLLANLVGNATSAILDLDPGAIYADRGGYRVERRQLHEAVAVMRGMGLRPIALPGADVRLLLRGLALPEALGRPIVSRVIGGARGGKSPSLRLHVRGGGAGPTEAGWLNGAVAAAGSRLGIPTPVNAALATLTDEVATDPDRASWFAGRPDRLAAAVEAGGAPP